ncbi:LysR family transcriptional regulator [Paracoccus sp. 22332]|uniref:LysR family transcriptional regulator n=1 Tax=Paracoccus sp. 22332 TaxID=3453913 RepID=UPI003F83EFCE
MRRHPWGFSRAAQELLPTQPDISDQVRKLEEEYDVLLFNRMRKQVTRPAQERPTWALWARCRP